MTCPLCRSDSIKILEQINCNNLSTAYFKLTKVDFSYLLNKNITYCECQKCKLRFFDPLITGDEGFYNSLQVFDWYYMDEKEEYFEAKKYISADDKVLEIGSGKGAFVKFLPTKQYVGLDFSEQAKEMAAKSGIVIKNEPIQDYAKRNPCSCDVVVSFQVLEHVSNPASFLDAKVNALVVGGKMIIAVPSENSFLKYASNNILNMPPHHVTRWSDETLAFIAKKYNLELLNIHHEKVQDIHKYHYLGVLVQNCFLQPKVLDLSIKRKIVAKLSSFFARILSFGLSENMRPYGHNVIAVYKKREAVK